MADSNENYLVRLYYTNFKVFAVTATGSDTALIVFFLYGRYPWFQKFVVCRLLVCLG